MPRRFQLGAPLNKYDRSTFYSQGSEGGRQRRRRCLCWAPAARLMGCREGGAPLPCPAPASEDGSPLAPWPELWLRVRAPPLPTVYTHTHTHTTCPTGTAAPLPAVPTSGYTDYPFLEESEDGSAFLASLGKA